MEIDWNAVFPHRIMNQRDSELYGIMMKAFERYHRQVERKFHKRMDAHVDKYHGVVSRREPQYCPCCGNRIHDR